jgi:peptidoglycan/LPS O-acetylase OafA/YrhL
LGVGNRGATGTAPPATGGAAPRHAGLTRLRLLLIGWVVLYHLDLTLAVTTDLPWLRPVLGVGYLGVDGFFLLSGFALWLGYGARPPVGWPAIRQFLLRRMAKIWPLHAAALLLLAALVGLAVLAGVQIRDPERFGLRDFLLQFFLVNAWETTDRHAWNYPSWALSVEWAGYLAFPLAIQGMLRLPRPAVPLVPVLALAGLAALTVWQPWLGLNYTVNLGLLRFALEFALGLALGRLALEGRLPRPWLLAGTAALPLGLLLGQDALTVAGLAALIPAIWHHGDRAAPGRAGRPDLLLRLGEASFGVYLCWVFVEAGLVMVLRRFGFGLEGRLLLMLAGILASLAAGYLAWRFVEVPAHRWILHRREGNQARLGLARPAAE